MSEKKAEATKTVAEIQALVPVMEHDNYVFPQYQDDTQVPDPTGIAHYFAEGFDSTPYQFQWVRYNQLDGAHKRYFTKVVREIHGALGWFIPAAFDPLTGEIVMGQEHMKDGRGEIILHVRPAAAAAAEKEQMIAFSNRKRNPHDEYDATVEEMNRSLAASGGYARDNSRKMVSTWPSGDRK